MRTNKLTVVQFFTLLLVIATTQSTLAAEEGLVPDIEGKWINLDANHDPTTATIIFSQNGRDISGKFTDTQNGKVIVDADLIGYVKTDGAVIFDVYFGRVTSTNRLVLSEDRQLLSGSYTNTIGGEGEVTLRRLQ